MKFAALIVPAKQVRVKRAPMLLHFCFIWKLQPEFKGPVQPVLRNHASGYYSFLFKGGRILAN